MGRKVYTNEFKQSVVEYFKTHTVDETMQKFGVPRSNISMWAMKAGFNKGKGSDKYITDFKHEVCQYYDNHTGNETVAKYGITIKRMYAEIRRQALMREVRTSD